MKRLLLITACLLTVLGLRAQSLRTCRYWFDRDFGDAVTTSFNGNSGQLQLNVDALPERLHTLHLQVADSSLNWGPTKSYLFMKNEDYSQENLSYRCWFDQDYDSSVSENLVNGTLLLDVSGLRSGMHTLHLMFEGSTKTSTKNYLFMKPEDYSFVSYRCWFDQDYDNCVIESFGDGPFLLDVSGLKSGMHTLHLMFEGSTKTSTKNYLFMKPEDYSFVSYRCWFDYDYNIGNQQTGSLESGTMLLDVSDLSNGIHTMHIQFEGSSMTSTKSYLFLKVPETEDCLYRCWFDQDESTVQTGQVVGSGFLLDVSALSIGQHDLFVQLSRGDLSSPRSYTFFHGPNITVIANPEEGGTVSTQLVDSICTITATANQGYNFVNWTENGNQVTTETSYSFVVTENDIERTFVANFMFAGVNYTVNATANPVEGGMVEGAGTYAEGETCTLTATPAEGYYFMNWTQGGTVVSSTATYSFVVETDVDLVANFAEGIYIGDGGTATSQYLPSYSYYKYSLTQQIYTAEEIGMAGIINSIAFKNTGAEKTRTYNMYMLLTDKDTFESGTDWVAMSENDLVFEGQLTFEVGQWTTITLETPFYYDGISNLIVGVADVTGAYSNSPHMTCLVFEAPSQAIRAYRDNSVYDITNPGVNGTVMDVKNQIVLNISNGSFCEKPSNFVADDIQADQVHLTWEGGSGYYNLEIKEASEEEWISFEIFGISSFTVTGLYPETDYNVRIQSVCEDGSISGWKTVNFTTIAVPTEVDDAWSDNFEDTTCGWKLINGDLTNAWAWGTAINNGGTHALYVSNDSGVSNAYTNNSAAMVYATKFLHFTDGMFEFSYDWIANGESNWDFLRVALVPATVTLTAGTTLPSGFNATTLPANWIALDGGGKLNLVTEWQNQNMTINVATGYYYLVLAWRNDTSAGNNPPAAVDNVSITRMNATDVYTITVVANPTDGGTLSGGGEYELGETCTLSSIPNIGYTFVNWTKDNVEVSTEATYSFTVTEDASYVANFIESQGEVTQETEFFQGYTWWSTYIEQEGINGLSILENGLGESGVGILSQADGFAYYYSDYGWYGSLAGIHNESSYKINTNEPCTAVMTGQVAVPSHHPITLSYGWTWLGYVPLATMEINEALSGLEATEGDGLKSQEGYSVFYAGYGWYGSLSTIEPGMGLMYYSSNSDPVTFTYPDNGRGGEMKANLTAEHNHWKPNVYAYPDNMTVMAVVELEGAEISSDNYELAAFAANGECRGSVRLIFAEPLHRHVAFLTVSGKDAAELSFRLYDTETGMEYYDAEESLSFVANALMGAADDLYTIHFRGTTGVDELANKMQVYPNPVNRGERFSINVADDVRGPVYVEIVNALGVETLRAMSEQTPVSMVAPVTAGVYTLRITVEGKGTIIRKLVVK